MQKKIWRAGGHLTLTLVGEETPPITVEPGPMQMGGLRGPALEQKRYVSACGMIPKVDVAREDDETATSGDASPKELPTRSTRGR